MIKGTNVSVADTVVETALRRYGKEIQEKDRRIAELEKEVAELKEKLCGYQDMLSFDEGWEEAAEDDQ